MNIKITKSELHTTAQHIDVSKDLEQQDKSLAEIMEKYEQDEQSKEE